MSQEWVADKESGRFSEGVVRETGQEAELDILETKRGKTFPSEEEYLRYQVGYVITEKNPLTLAISRSFMREIFFSFLGWCW